MNTQVRVFRDSSGDGFRWQAGAVFGYADTEAEARLLAERADNAAPRPSATCGRKPRKAVRP